MIARFLGRAVPSIPGHGGVKSHGPDPRALAFARGLAVGALFGAAVAGSRMWRRGRNGKSADRLPNHQG
jgi:hypothetical protein